MSSRQSQLSTELIVWLKRAALAFDDWFKDKHGKSWAARERSKLIPDCQDVSVVLAALLLHRAVACFGQAYMPEYRMRDGHWWLVVDGKVFDPKGYILEQRHAVPRAYTRHVDEATYLPSNVAGSGPARPFTSVKDATPYAIDVAEAVSYILKTIGPPPSSHQPRSKGRHKK